MRIVAAPTRPASTSSSSSPSTPPSSPRSCGSTKNLASRDVGESRRAELRAHAIARSPIVDFPARRSTMQQQQAFLFEIYRSGLRAAADMMKTSLESAERLQNQQLEGIRNAMEENVRSARQLSDVSSIGELMALQSRLAAAQMERN